ncbi:transmembrane protein 234 homolog [Anopheles aquasalis]|uniref:transmembrane protein 234 homolog n=1 Tax=Anopheles aquasalis TaxID=42839 RepID=UPI00215AC286|nr:transmembrane protein 234 homolog [Anopheles aquasalis]
MDSPPESAMPKMAQIDVFSLSSIVLVAVMWGATKPLIKKGSIGYNTLQANSKWGQLWLEIRFLVSRWQYILPLVIIQLGSIVYVLTLQRTKLSRISRVTEMQVSWLCLVFFPSNQGAREALRQCLPDQLPDPTFAGCLQEDKSTKHWLTLLLKNLDRPYQPPVGGYAIA